MNVSNRESIPQTAGRERTRAPKRRRRILRWAGWTALGLFVVIVVGIVAAYVWIRSLDIGKLATPVKSPTLMMDIHSETASRITSVKTDPVPLEQVPAAMRQAIVAVEDKRFYKHTGVDALGIFRAAFRNAKEGGSAEGGSTITQQLAKNVFLSGEKTLSRKLTEASYALKIEASYDKDQILEMYLNQIYFGEGQWGIRRAAQRYFGKEPIDLTLAECALLAALPKAPSRYSPYRDKELALERRNLVLKLMKDDDYITAQQYSSAAAEPIRVLAQKPEGDGLLGRYASYVDAVIDEAIQKYGFTERQLLAGDLKIYTELDPVVQQAIEKTYANDALFPQSQGGRIVQSGAVLVDPATGGVRGLVGQRGEHVYRGFNHATQLERQPGSIFKPLMVYAPALEKGYTPSSTLYDGPLDIGGYRPQDWDHATRGQVSLREAVVRSWNIPAVWLLNEIGLGTGKSFVQRLGVPLHEGDDNLGLALGGLSRGVSPLQMAQAYSVFPNLGTLRPAHLIVKITDADGRTLAEAEQEAIDVMSPEHAYTMTQLLMDVVQEGTGTKAAMDRPTAGKTGTTQLPDTAAFRGVSGGAKDAWFAGYTPELAGAVWMGYDETDAGHYLTTSGGQYPAMVFREMMNLALADVPTTAFRKPDSGTSPGGPGHTGKTDDKPDKALSKEERKRQKELEKEEKKREKEEKKRQKEREEEKRKNKHQND
ncbi:transglycosylase domain-containing protein [Cohnella sp. REN36]|uniref:transglycosylase domain-containing protein n=1 Tax=Cohnella sp. REN36 TaxID=2887347 RepID=UPI001D1490AF|nr:PBP1A family penicillin-binding protein [Cohnella sp. REN36]MCC3371617.1 PBP1A family penicillin-binding protein [Cohnella sp. REN36]